MTIEQAADVLESLQYIEMTLKLLTEGLFVLVGIVLFRVVMTAFRL